jgi:hypothetical protein
MQVMQVPIQCLAAATEPFTAYDFYIYIIQEIITVSYKTVIILKSKML